ncbi:hypothetical protein C9J44_01850 [Photobacterium sp. GB-27]|uniref:hypothetical protein n=1 Tax=unclassified Photobacterium TaxID=2628852 RepID=UPI000D1599D8|nr:MULTISPECIES: hypothetical protein [unclassified Photobacterium]PSV28957.1 hypothetical protein C9J42_01840 [Photobacterium sp. GB-56]PSV33188.1 hypothetical protein C9J40_01615 [Photobacterium sp. GB-72]PSV39548.1 hypothetical protein C9J44_01850 [Photobacterium sp. GB-27]PSV40851.1 hypothetical protein C9J38_02115 [Photobacterium sp. GB-210]PSV48057.1 hypothetical protein C9J46_01625 [Photobacterium sp. GB-36]
MRIVRSRAHRKQRRNQRQLRHCRYRAQQFFQLKYATFYFPYLPELKQTNDGIFQLSSHLIYRNYPAFIPHCLPKKITTSVLPTALLLAA